MMWDTIVNWFWIILYGGIAIGSAVWVWGAFLLGIVAFFWNTHDTRKERDRLREEVADLREQLHEAKKQLSKAGIHAAPSPKTW